MPKGWEKMKKAFMKDGMSAKAAAAKAARIWNSTHPDNPVGRRRHGGRKARSK